MALILLATAGSASAAPCSSDQSDPGTALLDADGWVYDFSSPGGLLDGGVSDPGSSFQDAWDGSHGVFVEVVAGPGTGETAGSSAAPDSCTREESGREIVYPATAVGTSDVSISRKLYVPSSGPGFARLLTVIENTGGSAVSVDVELDVRWGAAMVDYVTSSGDGSLAPGDAWAAHEADESDATPDVPLASLLDADDATADRFDDAAGGFEDGDGDLFYRSIDIDPGETAALMQFEAQRATLPEAERFARVYARGGDDLYTGLAAEERAALRNWPQTPPAIDDDQDGVFEGLDNCPGVANADQADRDGDGAGDACDADRDGDGLSNDVERSLGTNPDAIDSDNDGRPDGADACPTLAATSGNGCPPFVTGPGPEGTGAGADGPGIAGPSGFGPDAGLSLDVPARIRATRTGRVRLVLRNANPFPLEATLRLKGGRRVVARREFLVGASRSRAVVLRLSRAARRQLRRRGRLSVRAVAAVQDANANRRTVARRFVVTGKRK